MSDDETPPPRVLAEDLRALADQVEGILDEAVIRLLDRAADVLDGGDA